MLLTVLAITREVTLDTRFSLCRAELAGSVRGHAQEAPLSRSEDGGVLVVAEAGTRLSASHACLRDAPGPGMEVGHSVEDGAVEHCGGDFPSTITSCGSIEPQGTRNSTRCELSSHFRKFSFLSSFFHSCHLPSSLLGHRFSFFLFLTRYRSVLR